MIILCFLTYSPWGKINRKRKTNNEIPCFIYNKNQIILPSFGGFTGMHLPKIKNDDQVFVITNRKLSK